MKKVLFVISLLVLSFGAVAQEYKHTLFLKNGEILEGIILNETSAGVIRIKTDEGRIFVVKPNQIETITKEGIKNGKGISYNQSKDFTAPTRSYNSAPAIRPASSNENIVGYRGFIDLGYTKGTGQYVVFDRAEFSTSHGYQFSPYLFLGAGAGLHYFEGLFDDYTGIKKDGFILSAFADARCNFTTGKVVPYFGIKAGYAFDLNDYFDGSQLGVYVNPSFGLKVMVTSRMAVNFNMGYTVQGVKVLEYDDTENFTNLGGLNFRVGVEF